MTTKIKYREGIFGTLAQNRDIGKALALDRFERHLNASGDGSYGLHVVGGKSYGPMPLPALMLKTNDLIKEHHHPGFKLKAEGNFRKPVAYGILLTEPQPDITDTPGNDYVDLVYSMVFAKFPQATNLGNCYCRRIDGSYSWSQHAFCNAQDFGAPSGSQFWPVLNEIANYIVSNATQFSTETVIVQNRIWLRGQGWHSYSGQYHYHVHTDGYPNGTGTPACAR